jgi:hypothetical protein
LISSFPDLPVSISGKLSSSRFCLSAKPGSCHLPAFTCLQNPEAAIFPLLPVCKPGSCHLPAFACLQNPEAAIFPLLPVCKTRKLPSSRFYLSANPEAAIFPLLPVCKTRKLPSSRFCLSAKPGSRHLPAFTCLQNPEAVIFPLLPVAKTGKLSHHDSVHHCSELGYSLPTRNRATGSRNAARPLTRRRSTRSWQAIGLLAVIKGTVPQAVQAVWTGVIPKRTVSSPN